MSRCKYLGDLMLHGLELEDLLAELLPLQGVRYRGVQGTLGDAEHLGPDADAALVQEASRVLVALAELAQDVALRHSDVLEVHHARAGRLDTCGSVIQTVAFV